MKTIKFKLPTFLLIFLLIISASFLASCSCKHEWADATCTTAKKCSLCNVTEGEALGHSWNDATCETPTTCAVCGEVAGSPIGHKWADATCTTAKKCTLCNKLEGEPLGHNWKAATYSSPKTCSRCKATEGSPLVKPIPVPDNNNHEYIIDEPETNTCLLCSQPVARKQTPYCSGHACEVSSCPYPAKCKGGTTWGSHCAFHGCPVEDCLNYPIGGAEHYCASHMQ